MRENTSKHVEKKFKDAEKELKECKRTLEFLREIAKYFWHRKIYLKGEGSECCLAKFDSSWNPIRVTQLKTVDQQISFVLSAFNIIVKRGTQYLHWWR